MDWIAEAITQKFFIRSTYCELRGLSLAETKVFRDLMSEVNNLSYGDDAKLEDVIKRTKTAIMKRLGSSMIISNSWIILLSLRQFTNSHVMSTTNAQKRKCFKRSPINRLKS